MGDDEAVAANGSWGWRTDAGSGGDGGGAWNGIIVNVNVEGER